MLDAALEITQETGVQFSLNGLVFDEVVRRAGVSRTSAYRRWPTRDLFYGDVLVELAKGTILVGSDDVVLLQLIPIIRERADSMATAQDHRNLVIELLRVSLQADYGHISTSLQWKTFHALLASHTGIADTELRERVASSLAATLNGFNERRARLYAQMSALIGYRLIPPLVGPEGFDLMSRAQGALFLGALRDEATLRQVEVPRIMRAFGSTELREWTPTIYMLAASILAYVEPDPHVRWDENRIGDLITALETYVSL